MLVNMKAPRSHLSSIRNEPLIQGAQIRYVWADLEPEKNVYDFRAIEEDLQYLESMPVPKRLVIQIITADKAVAESQAVAAPPSTLPPWCHVYDGLSNEDIAEVESIALNRADLTRPVE